MTASPDGSRGGTPTAAETAAAGLTDVFFKAFRHHPAGVAIITANSAGGPVALTVSSLISVASAPPMVAFSLSDASSSSRAVRQAGTIVVHFARRRNMELARICATSGIDRFGPDVHWERLDTGEPHYPDVDLRFRAIIRGEWTVPGACLIAAELVSACPTSGKATQADVLVYADRTWHGLDAITNRTMAPLLLWPDDSAMF